MTYRRRSIPRWIAPKRHAPPRLQPMRYPRRRTPRPDEYTSCQSLLSTQGSPLTPPPSYDSGTIISPSLQFQLRHSSIVALTLPCSNSAKLDPSTSAVSTKQWYYLILSPFPSPQLIHFVVDYEKVRKCDQRVLTKEEPDNGIDFVEEDEHSEGDEDTHCHQAYPRTPNATRKATINCNCYHADPQTHTQTSSQNKSREIAGGQRNDTQEISGNVECQVVNRSERSQPRVLNYSHNLVQGPLSLNPTFFSYYVSILCFWFPLLLLISFADYMWQITEAKWNHRWKCITQECWPRGSPRGQ